MIVRALQSAKAAPTHVLATGAQIQVGQVLQRGSAWLAKRAGVNLRTLIEVLSAGGLAPRDPATIEITLQAAQCALETAGVEFIPENGGGAGVRLRKERRTSISKVDGQP